MPRNKRCPKCGTMGVMVKNGKTQNGTQRYRCDACHKTSIINASPTKHLQNSDYLLRKFIGYMIDDVALDVIARNLKINIKTAHYYRFLVFHSLQDYQDQIVLSGSILIDETFISIREKRYKILKSDGKDFRGLSFNQLCIITLINLQGLCVVRVSSRAMPAADDYKNLFNNNIDDVYRFLHDGNTKLNQFTGQFECDAINVRRSEDETLSSQLIDSLHSNLKRYLFKHAGYRLKHIQHYLNFFAYRYNHLFQSDHKNKTRLLKTKNQMIKQLYQDVKKTRKTVTYRTFLKHEGMTDILESH
jgi:ribosomal protein S27AE